ncbi:MAG: extensin family protein [Xanthobacteraceae bacterium]
MTPGVRKSLVGSAVLAALIAAAGCSHFLTAERDPWRHEAELTCINSGVPEEIPGRVRISSISGPGACGIDYPLKVSELGESRPLGYDDEPPVPPGSIPGGPTPQQWPIIQSQPLPPLPADPQQGSPSYAQPQYGQPQSAQPQYAQPYGSPQYGPRSSSGSPPDGGPQYSSSPYGSSPYGQPHYASPPYGAAPDGAPPAAGAPISLTPLGTSPEETGEDDGADAPHPYYTPPNGSAPDAATVDVPPSLYSPRPMMPPPGAAQSARPASPRLPPLIAPGTPALTAAAGPVEVKPAVTLACPIVSALDKWVSESVQPAALKWFHQPVVEIKQLGGYSCRGMINGNPNAPISEHAFGNAIDIAEFDLADGHRISVQYGWHGTPQEQGFLHDVQGAACEDFTTVLAPGANVYHYNHIHVDLMRRASRRSICEPRAIPGEIAAARAQGRYAAHYGPPGTTGSIEKSRSSPLGYAGDDDDRLPPAVPGDD